MDLEAAAADGVLDVDVLDGDENLLAHSHCFVGHSIGAVPGQHGAGTSRTVSEVQGGRVEAGHCEYGEIAVLVERPHGRCVDVALTLGPLLYEFDWSDNDWDRIAAGVVAGHLLECGPQATGGNYHDWKDVPGLEHVGYPIVEVDAEGIVVLTKAPGTGGLVNRASATEQLLHEIFDPVHFLSPDVTVDWTSIVLDEIGPDRVRVSGMRGAPPPATLRVSITYRDGYKAVLMWPYAWPDARAKAAMAIRKIEHTVARLGLRLDATRADVIGQGAFHGPRLAAIAVHGADVPEPSEVIVRFAARSEHRADIERLAAQQAPMHKGPPGLAGNLAGGRGQMTPIYSHWATTIPADAVSARIQMLH